MLPVFSVKFAVALLSLGYKFKKKLLRDLSLSGKIKFEGDQIVYTGNKKDSING